MAERIRNSAFTLVEVIIAVGILGMSVLAIVAFLGSVSQSTAEVIDQGIASRIADNVRAELAREDIDILHQWTDPTSPPIQLMATRDGERVRIAEPAAIRNIDNLQHQDPPGIPVYERYFLIEIRQLENSLEVPAAQFALESAMLPLSVRVSWPYQVKTGPESSEVSQDHQRSNYIFNTVILRKQ